MICGIDVRSQEAQKLRDEEASVFVKEEQDRKPGKSSLWPIAGGSGGMCNHKNFKSILR